MVDFHSHILPQVDDGSQSVEQTYAMLEKLREQGVRAVAATPHFDIRNESIDEFLFRRQQALDSLKRPEDALPRLMLGAEVLYCGASLHQIEGLDKLCLGNSRYLLIEPATEQLGTAYYTDMLRLMSECNITPILAHIERYYKGKNRQVIHELRREGAVLQMNAEAFSGWGKGKAIKLMKKERVQILGTDCHNLSFRPPNLTIAMEYIQKSRNQEISARMATWEDKILSECL